MEITADSIFDLLAEPNENIAPLQIREDPNKGVYVEGLIEKVVKTKEDLLEIIQNGAKTRYQQSYGYKSHAILQIFFEQRWIDKTNDSVKVFLNKIMLKL